MLTLTTLASGSSGNCALLSDGETHLLLDVGISCRRICTALAGLNIPPESLAGVLITHEHADHISGLATLHKRFRLPVYTSPGTARQLCYRIAALEDVVRTCAPGSSFTVGGLDVDANMNVLREDGTPIENLFAVGQDSEGVCNVDGKAYTPWGGQAQSWTFVSGQIAGTQAAAVAAAAE